MLAADIAEALLEIGLSAESTKAALATGGVKAREVSKAFGTEAVINAQAQQVTAVSECDLSIARTVGPLLTN